jgi:hypothetical protein
MEKIGDKILSEERAAEVPDAALAWGEAYPRYSKLLLRALARLVSQVMSSHRTKSRSRP